MTLLIIGITAWRTAQATAIMRRAVDRVTLAQHMVRMLLISKMDCILYAFVELKMVKV